MGTQVFVDKDLYADVLGDLSQCGSALMAPTRPTMLLRGNLQRN
jgi:hypothetical protein